MMKTQLLTRLLFCLAIMQLPVGDALAQLYLTPQVRPRAEWRNGYQVLPDVPSTGAFAVSQRSRLGLEYKQDKLRMKLSMQDVRVWGEELQLKDVPSLALHEAWGEVQLSDRIAVRLGRQEFVYNDDRLLGNVDWVQQARSHDAVLLKTRLAGWSLDIGGAYNQEREQLSGTFYGLNNYKSLGFVWAKKQLHENLSLSGMHVSDGFQRPDTVGGVSFRHTYGLEGHYRKNRMQLHGALYRQSGKQVNGSSIAAYMGIAELAYTLTPLKFTAGSNYLSGGFSTLYATNHKFYGYMDYFINIPADTRNGGLHDMYLKVGYSPDARYSLSLDYHYFALAKNLRATETLAGTRDKYLGSELDAVLQYKHSDYVSFLVGYSTMLAGKSMEAIKIGDASVYADWGWVMVNIQPRILLKSFDKEQ